MLDSLNGKNYKMNQEAVIIANGLFPTKESVINILKESNYLICCDGAIEHLEKHNISPDVIVGDLDSIPEHCFAKYHDKIVHINEQESNDLSKAFYYAKEKGYKKIYILGATGKRDDHTLANISLLYKFNKELETSIITDYGKWTVSDKSCVLDSHKGQQVSLFASNPRSKIYSEGLKYSLNGLQLEELWTGTLNEATGDKFSLDFSSSQLIIFREH